MEKEWEQAPSSRWSSEKIRSKNFSALFISNLVQLLMVSPLLYQFPNFSKRNLVVFCVYSARQFFIPYSQNLVEKHSSPRLTSQGRDQKIWSHSPSSVLLYKLPFVKTQPETRGKEKLLDIVHSSQPPGQTHSRAEKSQMGLEQETTDIPYSTKNSTQANLPQVKILKNNLRKVRAPDSEMSRNQDWK